MITPDRLSEIMYATEDAVTNVNEHLLRIIVKRIMATYTDGTGNLFIPATKNQLRMLIKKGMPYDELQEEIEKRLPEIQGLVRNAF